MVARMTTPTIPASIADVSTSWMTSVLRGSGAIAGDATVTDLATHQIGQGVGLMGELFVATLTYGEGATGDQPATVVVKLPATSEENRAQGIALGMYEAECRFYSEMGEATGTGLPVIHLSEIVSGTGDFVIVMEDLSPLRSFDQAAGVSVADAELSIEGLAAFHATFHGRDLSTLVDTFLPFDNPCRSSWNRSPAPTRSSTATGGPTI